MSLPPIAVDLWVWPTDGGPEVAARHESVLSPDEKKRAGRFLNPAHGDGFRIAHGRLRQLLGARTGVAPAALTFGAGANGKPHLTGPGSTLHFNLTHSGRLAALVVTAEHDIGVDIEEIRPVRENIAERYFSPAEIEQIRALPLSEQDDAFFRCWTRKEAVVKALGDGLTMPLDRFAVDIGATGERGLLASFDEADPSFWRVMPFIPAPGYHGAVAARTAGRSFVVTRHN